MSKMAGNKGFKQPFYKYLEKMLHDSPTDCALPPLLPGSCYFHSTHPPNQTPNPSSN